MATSPNANPTQITPPYVPLIDPRTGLIDRAWYMFFLSLFNAAQTALANEDFGPSAESLSASLEAAIDRLTQELQTQPVSVVEQIQPLLDALAQKLDTLPSPQSAELQTRVAAVEQELQTLPRPALGSMAALQQDNVPWLTFNTAPSPVPTAVGSMYWDGGTTMGVQATTDVLIRVGEAEYVYAKASSAITKGQLCYHTGAVGSSGVITVAPTPLALTDPNQIVGVAAETIALNGFGLIQISGDLRGFNTTGSSVGETWADGDPLYYNPAYVGSFTKTKPSAPNIKSYIGEVTNAGSGGSGSIHIRIVPGSVLGGTDANVQFGALNNGDLIQYDSALQYWKNVAASSVSVSTATNLAGGATGSVPYQSAASTTTFLPIGTAAQVLKVNAGATAPQWVSGAALTKTDDTNVTLTLGGTPATSLLAATSLTLGWTGQLAVSRGGTGLSSGTSGGIPYFSSTTAITSSALLAANALMVGGGAGAAPSTITTGTGVVTALGVNTGAAGAFVVNGGALGTPSSGTVTNLTGTASININGTVGATTPDSGSFTTLTTSSTVTLNGGAANALAYLNASKVLSTSTNAYFDGTNLGLADGNAPTQRLNLYRGGSTQTVMAVGNSNTGLNGTYFGVDTAGNAIINQTQALAVIISTNGTERARITSGSDLLVGTTDTGAAGLGVSNLLNLTFPEGSGTSYANLFRQSSSAATIIANGYKRSATASGFASSVGTSWAKSAIALTTGEIAFYADSATTVANGTDVTPTQQLRILTTGGITSANVADAVGYKGVPLNQQSTAYTLVIGDQGKAIVHPITDNNPRTFTIPANGSIPFPVGTTITFVNMINTVTIAITTDTMYLAGSGSTGSRTLAAYGMATAVKVTSTSWIISGNGLT